MSILPPEWAEQSAVQITWPHSNTDWAPWLRQVEPVYCQLASLISAKENVLIVCHDEFVMGHVKNLLAHLPNQARLIFRIAPCNDTWARDHGPITTVDENGNCTVHDFTFTGWGNKFSAHLDNNITADLISQHSFTRTCRYQPHDMVLEGGAIEVDEAGTLLTTEACLLNPNRNPHMDKNQIEDYLKLHLGIKRVLWLQHGELEGDDTDSHIDTLARFLPGKQIAYVKCYDQHDSHYPELQAMEQELAAMVDEQGAPYRLVPLPHVTPLYNANHERLPATYANFLFINDNTLLLPVYNAHTDAQAIEALQQALPDFEIVAVNCAPIVEQFGSLHCITMQIPAGAISR